MKKFGPDGRRFEHLSFLNLAQNVVCLVWAVIMLQFSGASGSRGIGKRSPLSAYWLASISNSFGPACGIQALKYISYPAQVSDAYCGFPQVLLC
jgi:UDP-galactose transporter B1